MEYSVVMEKGICKILSGPKAKEFRERLETQQKHSKEVFTPPTGRKRPPIPAALGAPPPSTSEGRALAVEAPFTPPPVCFPRNRV